MAEEAVYITPDGAIDLPFHYVYDGSSLTDGLSYPTVPSLHVPIQWDSDFILRSILGVPTIVDPATGGFRLYNYSGGYAMSRPVTPMSNQYAVMPEKIYPKNNVIKFDLFTVLRASRACGGFGTIYFPQVAFQGVKRYYPGTPGYASGGPQLPAPYNPDDFIPRPWTYAFQLNLNWFYWASAGVINPPRTFTVEVQDYDFELHNIVVTNLVTGVRLSTDLFQLLLYDSTAKRALASQPVNISMLNNNRVEYGNPVFPVPPLVYPVWTQIRFDIASLVCNTDGTAPYAFQVDFVGVNRIPKSGPRSGKQASGSGGSGK